jgi:hypothetical protein
VRVLFALGLLAWSFVLVGCGGSSSTPSQNTGVMTGNWQLNLSQGFPPPKGSLSAGGWLIQSNNTLTGSFQGPTIVTGSGTAPCGGVGPFSGTISGTKVTFSLNPGGTEFDFIGVISPDSQSMSGSYQALGGVCLGVPTSGTWTATLVPPLNGSFTGTLTDSTYMTALTGLNPPEPIAVTGSFTQTNNAGASNASITGTITAAGYPCFTTAYLSGTINGQNVYLNVFDYSGVQIGTLGVPGIAGIAGTPAVVASGRSIGVSLQGTGQAGLSLGNSVAQPCPTVAQSNGTSLSGDVSTVTLTIH